MTPLITIVTACYNSEHFLERSIQSVENQSYKKIEYIIIDGGSTDSTVSIIKKHEQSISKWISEPDKGVYDAWNKGIGLSNGDWIVFIGSDDILYPNAIENYVNYIISDKREYDFISSKMHVAEETGKVVRTFGRPWNWNDFRKKFIIAHPGSLHAKSYFHKYGLYNIDFKICGDYDMLLRAGKSLRAGYVDQVSLIMSLGGLSDTKKVFKESYRAIRYTGGLSLIESKIILLRLFVSYYVKHFFRFFGIHISRS